jgi:hypothetical protein
MGDPRLSSPRDTPVTAHRIRHGVGARPSASPQLTQVYKVRSSPATFQQLFESPFLPSLSCTAILPQASAGSTFSPPAPGPPQKDTTRAARKMPRRDCRLLFAHPLSSIVSSTVPAMGLHSTMTLANCLTSRPPATCSRGEP